VQPDVVAGSSVSIEVDSSTGFTVGEYVELEGIDSYNRSS